MSASESETPGWDAINEALKLLYGEQEPLHYAAVPHYRLGGAHPLDGISAYRAEVDRPHWHFVTYGFSELYQKELEDLEHSGYGFELTFRLVRSSAEKDPPVWVLNFLQNMARYVFKTGNVFGCNHTLNLNGPLALGTDTAIHAIGFTRDLQLPTIGTPNGRLEFLQIVGLTIDELETVQDWEAPRFFEILAQKNRLLVTDLARDSILDDPDVAQPIATDIEQNGTKCSLLFVESCSWEEKRADGQVNLLVFIGANQVERFVKLIRGRVLHGHDFDLSSPHGQVVFGPGDAAAWEINNKVLRLSLSRQLALAMCATLRPQRGEYSWPEFPPFVIRVVPSEIKDRDGIVVRVVG